MQEFDNQEKLKELLQNQLDQNLYRLIISNSNGKNNYKKILVRPIMQKGILIFQHAIHTDKQVFHKNLEKDESIKEILDEMGSNFMQLEIDHFTQFTTVLISKKGKQTIKCRKKIGQSDSTKEIELSHNRVKNYILKEGTPIPFLIDLGIQTIDGKVVKSKYDKFKQINRYLEFIEDVMDEFKEKQVLTILDFGCGKAYLTFAMYYYFTEIAKKQVKMIGLDLKEEVINNCNNLSQKYGFYGLEFRKGNIEDYNSAQSIDMVVTLHACDTATDYAIYKAIKWNAKVIFSVPCCQHEINKQIKNESMEDILKYGIIKERISALITDAIRANVLEEQGYETQILEFIDMEHTPKNLLIRSIRSDKIKAIGRKKKLQEFYRDFNITPTLVTLLSENQ